MGAASFEVFRKGTNPATALESAISDAQHEHGHGGYSGTIAEKHGAGFRKVQDAPLPLDAARQLANTLLCSEEDDEDGPLIYTDKWGPVNAIPIAPESAFRTKHKVLNISTKQAGYLDPLALAREHLRSATISGVEVLDDKRRTRVKRASGGKRTTKYAVLDRHNHVVGREDSLQSAKKKALELCAAAEGEVGFFVKGEIFADGGAPLFGCVQEQVSRRVKLKVTYVEQTRHDPAPVGWLFFGYASD